MDFLPLPIVSVPLCSPFSAFPTHLTIFTVVHPLLTWRWLGTNVGTSISPSYVLLSALAPPGARSHYNFVHYTVHGVATGPPRPFSIVE